MTETSGSATEALTRVKSLLREGEYLSAHDRAAQALEQWPGDAGLQHALVLSLARTGAVDQAIRRFGELDLDRIRNSEVLSLKARLSKDLALPGGGTIERGHLERSIRDYKSAYEAEPGYFPAINVATLSALSGDSDASVAWAETALADADRHLEAHGYYAEATRAEALLLLGRVAEAGRSLNRAAELPGTGQGEKSTTRKQLRLICSVRGHDEALLAPLAPPAILHFSGHIIAQPGTTGRFPAEQENEIQERVRAFVGSGRFGRAIGSLAAGADILVAEAALDAGVELDVVLPFARDEFIEVSVRPSGEKWVERFQTCIGAARHVHFVTEDEYLKDDDLFGYATEYALGLARLRAQWLDAEAHQISVWDGDPGPSGVAGTTYDLDAGKRAGFRQTVIPVRSNRVPGNRPRPSDRAFRRERRSLIFGDFKGFSRLTDRQLPIYIEHVLGACARVLDTHGAHLKFSNTWGDGLFLVFDDLTAAADCAFDLQGAIAAIPRARLGLPETMGLRLGFHYGPVYIADDPVLHRSNCFGYHVSRAARIEPITPEGSVYVTEQTAAAMAVTCPGAFRCDYVGAQPLAKGYGSFPMYHLRRIGH